MISRGNMNDRVDHQQYPRIDMRHRAIVNQVNKLKVSFVLLLFHVQQDLSTQSVHQPPGIYLVSCGLQQHAGLEKGHDCDAKRRGRSLLGILAGASLGFSRSV